MTCANFGVKTVLNLHLLAYTGSLGNGTDTQCNALGDSVLTITNNNFLMQRDSRILFGWAGGATLTDARYNAPSFANYGDVYAHPVHRSATAASNPPVWYPDYQPVKVKANEELKVKINDGISGTGVERVTVLALICGDNDTADPIPDGPIYTFRYTSTTSVTANAWTQLAITWTTTPPPGVYAVIDNHVMSANGIAWRIIFPPRIWRPGNLMNVNQYDNRWNPEKPFVFGSLGYFRVPVYPLIEVLCNSTDSSFTGFLTVKRMGNLQDLPAGYLG